MSFDFQISIQQGGRGAKKRLIEGTPETAEPKKIKGRIPRISRYMALAIHFEDLIRRGIVADYAELLHRSPKTLSNLFAQISPKTPLQIINERKMLEARRLLRHTDQAISEIAYSIGYEDVQTFSRFFKTQEGMSPSAFREQD